MTVATDLSQFTGKKVTVVHTPDGKNEAEELEGTAEAANSNGILIKPKGKTQLVLIEASQIEDVRFVDEKPKALARKTLKVVQFGQARAHLLERHAWTLKQVNEISEKEAFESHQKIDHEALDLGHVHGEKEKAAESDES